MSDRRAEVFAAVLASVRDGLSLRQSAAVQGVSHVRVAAWVALGDRETSPWAEFMAALVRQDAEVRTEVLADLRALAAVDNGARRDLLRQLGAPTALERELDQLRRMPNVEDAIRAETTTAIVRGAAAPLTVESVLFDDDDRDEEDAP